MRYVLFMPTTNDTADRIATKLTDREVQLLAAVTVALGGGATPDLSYAEWCEAEALLERVDGEC